MLTNPQLISQSLLAFVSGAGATAEPKAWCRLAWSRHRQLGWAHDLDDIEKFFWIFAPRQGQWEQMPLWQCSVSIHRRNQAQLPNKLSLHSRAQHTTHHHLLPFNMKKASLKKLRDLLESLWAWRVFIAIILIQASGDFVYAHDSFTLNRKPSMLASVFVYLRYIQQRSPKWFFWGTQISLVKLNLFSYENMKGSI